MFISASGFLLELAPDTQGRRLLGVFAEEITKAFGVLLDGATIPFVGPFYCLRETLIAEVTTLVIPL